MCKNKKFLKIFLNKHFKNAQQIVELALVLPFFIICFSFVFQLMVETYSKYKFAYIFTSAISRSIENQIRLQDTAPYTNLSEAADFNFKQDVYNNMRYGMLSVPNNGVRISDIQLDGMHNYLSGVFITNVDRLFFKNQGLEYFYFIVPVSRIYFEPLITNIPNDATGFGFFSRWYYQYYYWFYDCIAENPLCAPADPGVPP